MNGVTRRALVVGGMATLIGSLAELRSLSANTRAHADDVHGWLNIVVRLGQRYLEAYPEEASAAHLMGTLFGRERTALLESERLGSIHARLARARTMNFAQSDVVVLEGWVVARTEARLFALAALDVAG